MSVSIHGVSIERYREYLAYDETSPSCLRWIKSTGRVCAGDPAGIIVHGRWEVRFLGHRVFVHRVIYELEVGEIPDGFDVDHRDTNPLNNMKGNLRVATSAQNSWNTNLRSDSTSMLKGVSWRINYGTWGCKVTKHGKSHYATFDNLLDAAAFVFRKRRELHGEFARK